MDITGRDKIFDLALALEEAALNDEYFTSRKLFPNIDYWTAVIFNTLRFPKGKQWNIIYFSKSLNIL